MPAGIQTMSFIQDVSAIDAVAGLIATSPVFDGAALTGIFPVNLIRLIRRTSPKIQSALTSRNNKNPANTNCGQTGLRGWRCLTSLSIFQQWRSPRNGDVNKHRETRASPPQER